jgi:SAM-dependent methyltransferase
VEPGPPWNYEQLVRETARTASSVLDMGTGGGEFLAKVRASLPDRTVATEEWKINVPVAKERLTPLGVDVVECRSRQLPFNDATFDLVLNRHEDLEPAEIARVMSQRGHVITQQVGKNDWKEVRKYFPRMTDFGDHRGEYAHGFEAAGLKLTTNLQHDFKVAYATLGDFVYMLAVTPWTVPGFDLEHDIDSLLSLDAECHTKDGLVLTESRFLLVAEKPA